MVSLIVPGMRFKDKVKSEHFGHSSCTNSPGVKSGWLIMTENMVCYMQDWRQLTDLICCVPVTCCRTFSNSFSMRPAQWIILENKIRHAQSALSPEHVIRGAFVSLSVRVTECICKRLWQSLCRIFANLSRLCQIARLYLDHYLEIYLS